MLGIGAIVIGARDFPRAVEFWSAALDYDVELGDDGDWAFLTSRDGRGQRVDIMQVSAPAEQRRRHHLDLDADDQAAEVARLLDLGATEVPEWRYEDDANYIVLADPDGNYFCVCRS
ncbi:VOC family protein [Amnibacterium flavum]|uniref:VOC domain-containing protein n=1 Tax=Amnibacterium flavum TaxID=2173173 RepID=A0A2V1HU08_9MICO|nr:VOC family protein [Amnibacterium flavum]PVZ96058.1 hypothetical protein DDQ50_06355 [Amnibacterium flavum]